MAVPARRPTKLAGCRQDTATERSERLEGQGQGSRTESQVICCAAQKARVSPEDLQHWRNHWLDTSSEDQSWAHRATTIDTSCARN